MFIPFVQSMYLSPSKALSCSKETLSWLPPLSEALSCVISLQGFGALSGGTSPGVRMDSGVSSWLLGRSTENSPKTRKEQHQVTGGSL